MIIKNFIKWLESYPEDFEVNFLLEKEVEILSSTYPYPIELIQLKDNGSDCGYSDKVLNIHLKEE